jgi:3-oxoacyl-[acyl-carrier protein] reductase
LNLSREAELSREVGGLASRAFSFSSPSFSLRSSVEISFRWELFMGTQKLSGRVALVTGASKGIGACIAKALAAEGAPVVVNYSSSRTAAEKVVAEIEAAGGRALAVKANVSKSGDIARLFDETKGAFGKLDILVNNAGIYQPAPIGSITEESFHAHFDLNVLGLILASQEAVKCFGEKGGVIVNVSSVVALETPPGIVVYNATKGAVDSVTRSFAPDRGKKYSRQRGESRSYRHRGHACLGVCQRRLGGELAWPGRQSRGCGVHRDVSGFGRFEMDQRPIALCHRSAAVNGEETEEKSEQPAAAGLDSNGWSSRFSVCRPSFL